MTISETGVTQFPTANGLLNLNNTQNSYVLYSVWPGKEMGNYFHYLLEVTARYVGLLLASAEGKMS